jgi:membrane-anchored glycerophosphoryl diester phosphodiesterase (GDPDase)
MEKFSKKEAIKFGWEIAKKKIKFFILSLILVYGIPFFINYLSDFMKEKSSLATLFLAITGIVISINFSLGLIKISLKLCDGEEPEISDLFSQYRLFFRYIFALVLKDLITFFGFILLIIPGIILSVRLSFFDYLIVDKNLRIIESLKKSWEITKGNTWNLFLLYVLLRLVNLLGLLALIIGLFWSIPTTMLAEAFVYRKLSSGLKV